MKRTIQTRLYQDPLEGAFERRFPWSFVITDLDLDTPIHIVADDRSGREFALPVGVVLEMAEALRSQEPVAN